MIIRKTLKIDPNNQSVSSQSLLCAAALTRLNMQVIWTHLDDHLHYLADIRIFSIINICVFVSDCQ